MFFITLSFVYSIWIHCKVWKKLSYNYYHEQSFNYIKYSCFLREKYFIISAYLKKDNSSLWIIGLCHSFGIAHHLQQIRNIFAVVLRCTLILSQIISLWLSSHLTFYLYVCAIFCQSLQVQKHAFDINDSHDARKFK